MTSQERSQASSNRPATKSTTGNEGSTLSLEQLQGLMDASPYIASCGMTIVETAVEGETLVVTMPIKPEFERIPGSRQFHGGPIASLIDTAGCFALIMLLGRGVPTVNFRTDYLRPAIDTDLRAEARVRRVGRSVGVVDVDVDVVDDAGRLVAVGRGTFGSSQPWRS